MTYLDELLDSRRAAVERAKSVRPSGDHNACGDRSAPRRNFARALVAGRRPSIIAEFKRSSPSAGPIAPDADARTVAVAYERGGAAAISVLTEPERFGGSFDDLRAARAATSLPVLCKDFVVDDDQICEAARSGADAILLIVAAMRPGVLSDRIALVVDHRMTPLVEVHDDRELEIALGAGARVIGVNNRDLRSFAVDTSTATHLRPLMPRGIVTVAESGYRTADDLAACARAGYDAVLIGEALMREKEPGLALATLRGGGL
ncbi:MAG TPA: indole-3-glycerol phosphate synthase TrpC [Candidatus Eremiobacteraceae bacterium]|nr:indole-3-glycerol phosphate synthase TrpC [Candidatus Eremiobacteraceae bacterium]